MVRVRFSLRNLLVATTLIAIALGLWVYRSSSQRTKLNYLRDQGYVVTYRPTRRIGTFFGKLLGEDFVTTPQGLYCNGSPALETVARIPQIEKLVLSVCKVSDSDLKLISEMPEIDLLVINDTDVTDDGIRHLANLPLVSLDLTGLSITDECVPYLANIGSLRQVTISSNTLSADAQRELANANPNCKIQVE